MNRAKKLALLSNLIAGKVSPGTLNQLLQPNRVCGLLVYEIYEGQAYKPLPADEVQATLFYSDGRIKSQQMTYQQFEDLPDTVHRTLLLLPDNHRCIK